MKTETHIALKKLAERPRPKTQMEQALAQAVKKSLKLPQGEIQAPQPKKAESYRYQVKEDPS